MADFRLELDAPNNIVLVMVTEDDGSEHSGGIGDTDYVDGAPTVFAGTMPIGDAGS